jgi:hypothetical protein
MGVALPERERVECGRGDPARGVGVAAIIGVDGVFGEDVRVLYPFIVFRAVAFPPHHVPEAAITDLRFQDLLDLPLNVAVRLEDGRGFVVPRTSGKRIRFRELKFHHREDRVELGVPRGKLELVCTLSDGLHDFEGAEAFVREFDGRTGRPDVGGVQPDSVAYFDLWGGRASAIVVQLELVLGFNERGFGFRDSGRDPVSELVRGFHARPQSVGLEPHPREPSSVRHEWDLLRRGMDVVVVHELRGRKKLVPVVLFVVCEDPDELLELLVDALGLAVDLRVVSGGGHWFCPDEAPQFHGELCDKLQSPVGDVFLGGSAMPPDIPVVEPSGPNCTEASVALVEVGLLT